MRAKPLMNTAELFTPLPSTTVMPTGVPLMGVVTPLVKGMFWIVLATAPNASWFTKSPTKRTSP